MVSRPAQGSSTHGPKGAAALELSACVLGMVRLVRGADDVPLTPSERALVAGLAVADHRVVTVDALAGWIWGGRSHASPRNRVQAVVSGIRRKVTPWHRGVGVRPAARRSRCAPRRAPGRR